MARKVKSMKIRAVALVDMGANRRRFFLYKSSKGGTAMNKDVAIEILKSAKELNENQVAELIKSVKEEDRAEVQAFAETLGDFSFDGSDKQLEVLIEKVGKKFSKQTEDAISQIAGHIKALSSLVGELTKGMKEGKYPYPAKKAAGANADEADLEKGADMEEELSDAEFEKLIDEKLKSEKLVA